MPLITEKPNPKIKIYVASDHDLTEGTSATTPQATEKSAPPIKQWPADFFEETYGCLQNDPLTLLPQGSLPPLVS